MRRAALHHTPRRPQTVTTAQVRRLRGRRAIGLGSNLTLNATVKPDLASRGRSSRRELERPETFLNGDGPFFVEARPFSNSDTAARATSGLNWSDRLFHSGVSAALAVTPGAHRAR